MVVAGRKSLGEHQIVPVVGTARDLPAMGVAGQRQRNPAFFGGYKGFWIVGEQEVGAAGTAAA